MMNEKPIDEWFQLDYVLDLTEGTEKLHIVIDCSLSQFKFHKKFNESNFFLFSSEHLILPLLTL